MEGSSGNGSSQLTPDDPVLWPQSASPIETLQRLETPSIIPETDDFPWPQQVNQCTQPVPLGFPDPTLPHVPIPTPPETPSTNSRPIVLEKPKNIKIPPAEREITRMRKESYIMFTRKKHEQHEQPPPTRNVLRDLPLSEVPLYVPADKLEDEVMASNDCAAVEQWVNAHLTNGNTQLIPVSDAYLNSTDSKNYVAMYQSKLEYSDVSQVNVISSSEKTPLQGAGIDSASLLRLGMPRPLVERIYRGLFVYTSGFHSLIHEIGRHCPAYAECHIAANVWLAFLHLLEKCEDGRYEMAMLKFNHATSIWKKNKMIEYEKEKETLNHELTTTQEKLQVEKDHVVAILKKQDEIVQEMNNVNEKMEETKASFNQFEDDIRILKLEIMDLEDRLASKTEEQNQTSCALSLALTQKSDAENVVENCKTQISVAEESIVKLEAHKVRSSSRIRELQATSQVLRDQIEATKNDSRVLTMENSKLTGEKTSLVDKVAELECDNERLKAQVQELSNLSGSQKHDLDERDASILSLTDAMEKDRGVFVTQLAEIARLNTQCQKHKLDYGVLEAQVELLLIEKKNAIEKEADKARIERLLNKKVELEKEIELLQQEKEQGQEQIWNLRASIEALENDLHHSKRAYASSQTSLSQAERICEHMRGQMQEMERVNDRLSSSLASQKQQSKLLDDASREQVEKMETELRVVMSQMREMVYTRRENEAQINDLTKSLEASNVEIRLNKQRIEKGDKALAGMTFERDTLLRDKRIAQLEQSTNQAMVNRLNQATAQLMEKIRMNEVNYEEAMQELRVHYDNAFHHPPNLSTSASGVDLHSTLQPVPRLSQKSLSSNVMHSSVSGIFNLMLQSAGGDASDRSRQAHGLLLLDSSPNRPVLRRRRSLKGGSMPSQNEFLIKQLKASLSERNDTINQLEDALEESKLAFHMEQLIVSRERVRIEELKHQVLMAGEDADMHRFYSNERYHTMAAYLATVESDLRDQKSRVATLRTYLRNYKTYLDHMGMHAEDARGTLMILRHRFLTRIDKEIQAVEPVADNTTQTYPPRRSPIKERAKLKQSVFSLGTTANDVLNSITDLLPDEELDNHFFSITHHGRVASREYKHGHLLDAHNVSKFHALPRLAATPSTHPDPSNAAASVRAQVALEYKNEFGHVERVAEPQVSPFLYDTPRRHPHDDVSIAEKLARELHRQENERLTQEISDTDFHKSNMSRAPARPSPRVGQSKPQTMKKPVVGHRRVNGKAPPVQQQQEQQEEINLPTYVKPKKPRRIKHAVEGSVVPENEVEAEVIMLEEMKAREHSTPYTPPMGKQRGPECEGDFDDDSEVDQLGLENFFVEEDGVMKRKGPEVTGQRVPSLLEQKVKEMRENEALREAASPTRRLVGWELGRQSNPNDTLPPILYPLTKS